MTPIPDFTDADLAIVRDVKAKRYGKSIELQLADSALRLDPGVPALTACPTVSTGHESHDNWQQGVPVRLQVQADHKRQLGMPGDGIVH